MLTALRPSASANTSSGFAAAADNPSSADPSVKYVSNALIFKGSNPKIASEEHVKAMIATLHEKDISTGVMPIAIEFIDCFSDLFNLER